MVPTENLPVKIGNVNMGNKRDKLSMQKIVKLTINNQVYKPVERIINRTNNSNIIQDISNECFAKNRATAIIFV